MKMVNSNMTKKEVLMKLITFQKLLWKNDDMMHQETLLELQDSMQDTVFKLAIELGFGDLIVSEFPWLYRQTTSE